MYKSHPRKIFWFSLSLAFAALYGYMALRQAFSSEYVVQDDARQHVFWMWRFLDPELFPRDSIADYFQSVAPAGYTALYQISAFLGIDPIFLSKVLPIILGLITTGYCFGTCMQLLPVPMSGFIASLLLNQNLWMQDGLISGTPKAFVYPIFLAFLYYVLQRWLIGTGIAIALLGLFYPSLVLVCAAVLLLQLWHFDKPYLSRNKREYLFCAIGLAVAVLVLLPYALSTSTFEPVITAAEAKTLPEFLAQGRNRFFVTDPWAYWLHGRSGIGLAAALTPPLIYTGLLLPILLKFPSRFPLTQQISSKIRLLPQLLLASGVMFFAAHALLFKLHLPSRYTQHSLRIVVALAAGITLTLILDWIARLQKSLISWGLTALIAITLIAYPNSLKNFPWTYYIVGKAPALYEFLQQQPKDITIASLADEANNIPTFAQRSILVGSEYAIPYHLGYYRPFRQRLLELFQAQYSQNLADVQNLIQKYGIDFWLIDKAAFTPEYISRNRWLNQYQEAKEAIAQLQVGNLPAISRITRSCQAFERDNLVLLTANCIKEKS